MSRIYLENMLSHTAEKFCRRNFQCVSSFGYRISLRIREEGVEGGSITTFCQNFLCHIEEKNRRGTFLCFKKLLV